MNNCYCEKLSNINYHTVCEICWKNLRGSEETPKRSDNSKGISETLDDNLFEFHYKRGYVDGLSDALNRINKKSP